LFLGICLAGTALGAPPQRRVTKLAEGVYAIEHQVAADGSESGNTTVIIGDKQVFVVDSCFLPSAAQEDIAQIRQWTDKPVSFVLNTHFHNDHNLGNRVYMDAFPAVTIISHVETKRQMDMFGPGSASRLERSIASLQRMLDMGKTKDGQVLTAADKTEVKDVLGRRQKVLEEIRNVRFQSATLTFDHDFSIDVGAREVQIKFMGRGNTGGDAVVYLPKEKIVVAGDLVVYPIPYIYDGYPSEWVKTLQQLVQLNAETIVPGHGPILHDNVYVGLIGDLLKSALSQMDAELVRTGAAMFRTLEEVKASVDLTPFRQRFAGNDKDLLAAFDEMSANLVKVMLQEASLR
jgi:cyclase